VAFIAAGIRSGKSAPLSMLRNSEQGDDSTVGRIDVSVWSRGLSVETLREFKTGAELRHFLNRIER
jgi:hypothetical protein